MLVMVVLFIAFRWIHLSTPLIRLFLLVLILLLMPTLNFLPVWFDLSFLFFFQAEDGIRDVAVTGVQTCALPISADRVHIVVIADNCRDRTAEIARAAGVQCLERDAPQDPGKPRAIAWALGQLPVRSHDAVVIVDADTEVDADFIAYLATASPPLATKVLQPYNGVSNARQNALTRMAAVLSMA